MTDGGPEVSPPRAPAPETEHTVPPYGNDEVWRIGGVRISRKIDVLAFAAFFLSIATITIQLTAYLSGARLTLLPPDQVFFRKDASYSDKIPRARFGATLTYVNRGEKGYGAVVLREAVNITIAKKNYEQAWDEFVSFDGYRPKDDGRRPAKPFTVDGGATESHQTDFIPWPKRCVGVPQNKCAIVEENHVHWYTFINELRRLSKAGQHEFEFAFAAELIDGEKAKASCKIEIDETIIAAIEQLQGYNPTCYADEL